MAKMGFFGLDVTLMKLVHFFKSAAFGYGTEKRVLLLHGPCGLCTIHHCSNGQKRPGALLQTDDGALYTFKWIDGNKEINKEISKEAKGIIKTDQILGNQSEMQCPMHEEPLKLIPTELRANLLEELNKGNKGEYRVTITGDLCPACRYVQREFMKRYQGDLSKVLQHIRVERLILSEKDRLGIGTFQPKDEKKSRFHRAYG
ncbi:unnamed protein product [Sphagnum tenellum]